MPDTEGPSTTAAGGSASSSSAVRSDAVAEVVVNLPIPIKPRESGDGFFSRWLRTIMGWRAGSTRADLKEFLEESAPGELGFSPEESTMLKNILGLRERRIDDVMVPRADIIAVQQEIPLGELVKVFQNAGHSRLVVFNDTLDDPVGMVHIRDLIGFMTARATAAPKPNPRRKKKPVEGALDLSAIDLSMQLEQSKIVRPILFVPPSMPAIDLLAKMQATRIHLALVVDEYGGTDGIVSIEDVVELIVGNIEDEHDDEEAPGILKQSDGSFVADARASLEDVIAAVGKGFDVGEALNNVDTLAGYLVTQVGRVPVRGELVPGPEGFEFEVLDADPRRVKKVRIHRGKNRKPERRDAPGSAALTKAPGSLPRDPGANKPTQQP